LTIRGGGTPDVIPGPPKDEAMAHHSRRDQLNHAVLISLFHRILPFCNEEEDEYRTLLLYAAMYTHNRRSSRARYTFRDNRDVVAPGLGWGYTMLLEDKALGNPSRCRGRQRKRGAFIIHDAGKCNRKESDNRVKSSSEEDLANSVLRRSARPGREVPSIARGTWSTLLDHVRYYRWLVCHVHYP